MKKLTKIGIISLIVILIDQIIKIAVTNNITYLKNINIIPRFLYLTNVHNDGAAWSILNGNTILLVLIAIVALVAISYYLYKSNLKKVEEFLYAILIGSYYI